MLRIFVHHLTTTHDPYQTNAMIKIRILQIVYLGQRRFYARPKD